MLKIRIKGSPTSETGKSRHALRTAHRAYRMTFKAKSDKTFFKNLLTKQKKYGIMQTEREARTMKAKSLGHLNMNAISKLYDGGIYDTKKYRYIVDQRDGEIYRIEKDLLGTTEALDPENWIKQ